MAKEPVTKANVQSYIQALEGLAPDATPIFGSLDAIGVVRHLRYAFETSLGEPESADESKAVVRTIMWILFFNVFTNWPGGKIKSPEVVTPAPEHAFEEERRLLVDAMSRFADRLEAEPNEKHVNLGLGPLTLRQWSRLHGVHCAHHFRQFGLTR